MHGIIGSQKNQKALKIMHIELRSIEKIVEGELVITIPTTNEEFEKLAREATSLPSDLPMLFIFTNTDGETLTITAFKL